MTDDFLKVHETGFRGFHKDAKRPDDLQVSLAGLHSTGPDHHFSRI